MTLDLLNRTTAVCEAQKTLETHSEKMIDRNYHLDKHDTLPAFVD